jgi:protein-tyrosine-phosphatase
MSAGSDVAVPPELAGAVDGHRRLRPARVEMFLPPPAHRFARMRPGRRYLDWNLPDPDGAPQEVVRAVRDDITARVRALLAELDAAQAAR